MSPKNILLLYKNSTYNHYDQKPYDQRPDDIEIDRFRSTHEAHFNTLAQVENILNKYQLNYQKVMRGGLADYHDFDFIVCVGGDGTVLEAARYADHQLILGVNSDPNWSVGKLCFSTLENFESIIDGVLSDSYNILHINRLAIDFSRSQKRAYCLNDFLLAHSNPASLSRYRMSINGVNEEQRGSGVWFSTAAGSTGAIHSAGGELMELKSDSFQYLPRELYKDWKEQDHCLVGGILPKESSVMITSMMSEGAIFVDGSHQRIAFETSEIITVSVADQPLLFLTGQ